MANRLAGEPSPYLRQHQDNPVDWWPWGDAAFAEARRRDVPVFLSIGYSTCHWCHVMAHESFEDPGVARLMNEAFVNVKVDREERPDVDAVYMHVCQLMTGSGGWPLTVLLTPERKPFFAGTYFPKLGRHGRMGMMELVPALQEAWRTRRKDLEAQAEHILQHVRGEEHAHPGEEPAAARHAPSQDGALGEATLQAGLSALRSRFDARHGGFGGRPKFPSAQNLLLLLRLHARDPGGPAIAMVAKTIDAMARGGIQDHLGGGFHRYSTDERWLLPHFEKILYDQAMLAYACTEAFEATRDASHAATARATLDYVLRDLQDPAGGFRCGEDADSEGEEGRFYVWTQQELEAILGPDAGLFCRVHGVQPGGNFQDEATGHRSGANVLHLPRPLADAAAREGIPLPELEKRLATMRSTLLAARARRARPGLDDKVLTDWNGLAIAALARAGLALKEPRYTKAAERAASFLQATMRDDAGRLRHRFRAGTVDSHSFLDDHAYLLWGLLELHQATQDARWLEAATGVAAQTLSRFADADGGLFLSPHDGEPLPARRKEAHDGALPSGNGVAAWQLERLSLLTGDVRWSEAAARILAAFAPEVALHPHAYPALLCALDLQLGPTQEVAVTPGPGSDALLAAAREAFRPRAVVLLASAEAARAAPWVREHRPLAGRAAAYVCVAHACRQPVATPEDVRRLLAGP